MISGYQIPYKSEKLIKTERPLSVQVRVTGVEEDIQCDRTKTVKNNGPYVRLSVRLYLCPASLLLLLLFIRDSKDPGG